MASSTPRISKSEWQQVSRIAAELDWTRVSGGVPHASVIAGLNDRSAAALQHLLHAVAM